MTNTPVQKAAERITKYLIDHSIVSLNPNEEANIRAIIAEEYGDVAELSQMAHSIVCEWHGDDDNLRKEVNEGTPDWLHLCRKLAKLRGEK